MAVQCRKKIQSSSIWYTSWLRLSKIRGRSVNWQCLCCPFNEISTKRTMRSSPYMQPKCFNDKDYHHQIYHYYCKIYYVFNSMVLANLEDVIQPIPWANQWVTVLVIRLKNIPLIRAKPTLFLADQQGDWRHVTGNSQIVSLASLLAKVLATPFHFTSPSVSQYSL